MRKTFTKKNSIYKTKKLRRLHDMTWKRRSNFETEATNELSNQCRRPARQRRHISQGLANLILVDGQAEVKGFSRPRIPAKVGVGSGEERTCYVTKYAL